ncbi:hypothetical protein SDC9_112675 [bioreactor metagenome]|uniref:Uncharacterized protein n=1 Tax=bioreactor metagenome TaxID=1076179 RepID=A0A645BRB7_9ZZZZ
MAVSSDDEVSGSNQAFLREQGMLDAHLPDVEVVGDLMVVGKSAQAFALLGCLDVLVRGEMVWNQSHLILVEYGLLAELRELIDGHRSRNIVAKHHVQVRHDQLACTYRLQIGMVGQDLLRHCHTHRGTLLTLIRPTAQRRLRLICILYYH